MEIITVGKPAIDVYLNLVEFPMEGDVFRINKKVESVGNASATSAVMLAKWGFHVNFVGSIGDDGYADKIQNVLKEHKISLECHSHPDYDKIIPSQDDRDFIARFGQKSSRIVSSYTGKVITFQADGFFDDFLDKKGEQE